MKAVAAAYLRAAHAYMLISMPTGTSTIFGVFQAILALLVKPDELRPAIKVIRNQNFASEIFFNQRPRRFMLQCKKEPHAVVRARAKPTMDQWVHIKGRTKTMSGYKNADAAPTRRGKFRIKHL
jgi:hypothetical protein